MWRYAPHDLSLHPLFGFAAIVISVCVILFLALIAFIFWLSELGEKGVKLISPTTQPIRQPVQATAEGVEYQPAGARESEEFLISDFGFRIAERLKRFTKASADLSKI